MALDKRFQREALLRSARKRRRDILKRKSEGAPHKVIAKEFSLSLNGISWALCEARRESALAEALSNVLDHPVEPWELDCRAMDHLIGYGRTLRELFGPLEENGKWLERDMLRAPQMGPVKVAKVMEFLHAKQAEVSNDEASQRKGDPAQWEVDAGSPPVGLEVPPCGGERADRA